jgi:EAL domain-containing protein (putative c-di-GMP-specific phosphodiesterase class I)/ActR/RegA family two-component response regulator
MREYDAAGSYLEQPRASSSGDAPPEPAVDFEIQSHLQRNGLLIVDDHKLQRQTAVWLLRELGYTKIHEAADGDEALDLVVAAGLRPALILLDLGMPRMDGFETMRRLAQHGCRTPILVLSGCEAPLLDSMSVLADELNLPFLGSLPKPMAVESFTRALSRYRLHPSPCASNYQCAAGTVCAEDLRRAVMEGWIVPYYQPKVNLRLGVVTGFEALARWCQPGVTPRSPSQFIAAAEREHLIDALTLSMFDQIVADLAHWYEQGWPLRAAINISGHSLSRPEFSDALIAHSEHAGACRELLDLEITESALASDVTVAIAALGRLRMRGFGLSLDDYGTGFSSLQQLARMPFSELKIDRSFVRHAFENERHRTILSSAIDIGRRLGLRTVAEGIECRLDLEVVAELGCEHAQGFLFAQPMPAAEVLNWLSVSRQPIADCCRHLLLS